MQQIEFGLCRSTVRVNYTVCILRYLRRFEGKISDLVDLESGGLSPTPKVGIQTLGPT